MYFRPSDHSTNLLQAWHDMCMELNNNNQGAFNRVFSAGIRREMDYYIMPKELYPHGALIEQVCLHVCTFIPYWLRFSALPLHRACASMMACLHVWLEGE